jgi:hypothetical protein
MKTCCRAVKAISLPLHSIYASVSLAEILPAMSSLILIKVIKIMAE